MGMGQWTMGDANGLSAMGEMGEGQQGQHKLLESLFEL